MRNVFLTFFILFTTWHYAQQQTSRKTEIPFTQTAQGHIIIPATINGIPGNFIFDTGAGLNLLTKTFADKITDLEKTDHFYTGHRATGEELQVDLWHSKNIKIGSYKLDHQVFAVYDIDFPLDGLISLTPFKDTPITIDFDNKLLTIESEHSLNRLISEKDFEMPIQITNDRDINIAIATTIHLEETLMLNVVLDSGAGFDVFRFSARFMPKLGLDNTKLTSAYKPSMFKPEHGNQFYYTTLSQMTDRNHNIVVNNFKTTFIDGLIYEGITGMNWIGKKITIDIPQKRLVVQK